MIMRISWCTAISLHAECSHMHTTHNGTHNADCTIMEVTIWSVPWSLAADGSVCLYVVVEVGGGYVGITDLLAFIDCSWPRGCSSGTDALVTCYSTKPCMALDWESRSYPRLVLPFEANGNFINSIFEPASWCLSNTIAVDFCHVFLLGYWCFACWYVSIPVCFNVT